MKIEFKLVKQDFLLFVALVLFSCNQNNISASSKAKNDSATSCMMVPARFSAVSDDSSLKFNGDTSVKGMVFIKGETFMMGGDNSQASEDEFPKHKVEVSSFWMDETEVPNAQFAKFVKATHYITTAEKKPDWEQMKQMLPPGTPKPPDSLLVAASLVVKILIFSKPTNNLNFYFLLASLFQKLNRIL
jgi:formylglycine-generating enzyme required for sulfatase activity